MYFILKHDKYVNKCNKLGEFLMVYGSFSKYPDVLIISKNIS